MIKYFLSILWVCCFLSIKAQDTSHFTQTEIIYGRKDGMALTMMKLTPKKLVKGKAIVKVISGNWKSGYDRFSRALTESTGFLEAGYTVFAVLHSSQPRYTIVDQVADLKRAVRFIRYYAKEYNIDPEYIGITGSSSGGHLSLMIATAEDIPESSPDPINQVSAKVQAAVVFFPPTDFLNYGKQNTLTYINDRMLTMAGVAAAFDFKFWNDTTQTYSSVKELSKKADIARQVSPANFVTADDPPVLFFHGDKDFLVPVQQSQLMIDNYKKVNVPSELIIRKDAGHGWKLDGIEEKKILDWFNKYL